MASDKVTKESSNVQHNECIRISDNENEERSMTDSDCSGHQNDTIDTNNDENTKNNNNEAETKNDQETTDSQNSTPDVRVALQPTTAVATVGQASEPSKTLDEGMVRVNVGDNVYVVISPSLTLNQTEKVSEKTPAVCSKKQTLVGSRRQRLPLNNRFYINWQDPRILALIHRYQSNDPSVRSCEQLALLISEIVGETVTATKVYRYLNKHRMKGSKRNSTYSLVSEINNRPLLLGGTSAASVGEITPISEQLAMLRKSPIVTESIHPPGARPGPSSVTMTATFPTTGTPLAVTSTLPRCTGGCYCAVCHHAIIYPQVIQTPLSSTTQSHPAPGATAHQPEVMDVETEEATITVGPETPIVHSLAASKRLTHSMLTISLGNNLVRQFRFSNNARDGKTKYYRCSRCETMNKRYGTDFRPRMKTYDGVVVTNVLACEHHPDCQPILENDARLKQIIQEQKGAVRTGLVTPKEAWSNGKEIYDRELASSDSPSSKKYPKWDSVRKIYYNQLKAREREELANKHCQEAVDRESEESIESS